MSIIIAATFPDRALVAVDTLGTGPSGQARYPKAFTFMHLPAVLAGRGSAKLIAMIVAEAALCGGDFDALAAALPGIIGRIMDDAAEHLDHLPDEQRSCEIVLAGFSAGSPILHTYSGGETVEHATHLSDDCSGAVVCAPPIDPMPTLADVATLAGLHAVANKQVRRLNDWAGRMVAGGELIAAEVRAAGITTANIGPLAAAQAAGSVAADAADPWMIGFFAMGLGTLASRSPYPGVALGEGGLKGLQSWEQAQGMVPKIQLAQAEAAQRELPLLEMPLYLRMAGMGGQHPVPGTAPGAVGASLAAAPPPGTHGATPSGMGAASPPPVAAAMTAPVGASGAINMPPEIGRRISYDRNMARYALAFGNFGEAEKWNADADRLLTGTPAYQGQITSARNWAAVPPDIYKQTQEAPIAAWRAGLTKGQEFRYQFNQVRPGSAGLLGGKPVVVVPEPREYVNPVTGERYWGSWTPPVQSIPSTPPASAPPPNRGPTSATSTAPSPQTASTSPPPTQGGTLPPGMEGVAGLGPGQEEALKTRAEEVQKQRQDTIRDAATAQTNQTVLNEMESDAQNFTTGPFAAHKYAAKKYLRMLNPAFNQPVASYEDFIKELGIITRTTVRQVSSRAAVQEFSLIQQSLPNPEMSPLGLQQVTAELKGLNDYSIAKLVAQNQWERTHQGNLDNFESTFEQNISPYPFLVHRLPPQIRQNLYQHLAQTSEGRRELGLLRQQMQMIDESGLNAGAQ